MNKHLTLNDQEFLQQFQGHTFPPSWFSHEAHLRLAWIHLHYFGLDKATQNMTEQIKAFASFHGDNDKYNETLTVAAVQIVNHFKSKCTKGEFQGLLSEFPQLKTDFRRLINAHYSKDIYTLPEAKIKYIKPNLLPF